MTAPTGPPKAPPPAEGSSERWFYDRLTPAEIGFFDAWIANRAADVDHDLPELDDAGFAAAVAAVGYSGDSEAHRAMRRGLTVQETAAALRGRG